MSSRDVLELPPPPPDNGYAMFEFGVEWPRLDGAQAQLASAMRLFVITRDPLDWLPDRGAAWTTANADGDTLELPIYVTLDEVQRQVGGPLGTLDAALGSLAAAALDTATQCQGSIFAGAYPELAFQGSVPRLLDHAGRPVGPGAPTVTAVSEAWEPLGLGAIQDLVQDAFGPVDLDRSLVALQPAQRVSPGCPACAGNRFGFPGELAETATDMCEAHRSEASAVTASRIARARSSNRVGWRAIGKGSARISGVPEPEGTPLPQRHGSAPTRNAPCPCGSGRKYKHCCGR